MRDIILFFVGIIGILFIVPVIQSFSDFICCKIEKFKALDSMCIVKANLEMQKMQSETEDMQSPYSSSCIGFEVDDGYADYYYEDDDDDYYEDRINNKKNQIGF